MKIEFTEQDLKRLTDQIGTAATAIFRQEIAALEETELLADINRTEAFTPTEKFILYLDKTKCGLKPDKDVIWVSVESEYLRRNLGLTTEAMRELLNPLEADGSIVIDREDGHPDVIRYVQSD